MMHSVCKDPGARIIIESGMNLVHTASGAVFDDSRTHCSAELWTLRWALTVSAMQLESSWDPWICTFGLLVNLQMRNIYDLAMCPVRNWWRTSVYDCLTITTCFVHGNDWFIWKLAAKSTTKASKVHIQGSQLDSSCMAETASAPRKVHNSALQCVRLSSNTAPDAVWTRFIPDSMLMHAPGSLHTECIIWPMSF